MHHGLTNIHQRKTFIVSCAPITARKKSYPRKKSSRKSFTLLPFLRFCFVKVPSYSRSKSSIYSYGNRDSWANAVTGRTRRKLSSNRINKSKPPKSTRAPNKAIHLNRLRTHHRISSNGVYLDGNSTLVRIPTRGCTISLLQQKNHRMLRVNHGMLTAIHWDFLSRLQIHLMQGRHSLFKRRELRI